MSIMALQKYNKSRQLFRAKQRTKNIITSYKENLNFSNIEYYDQNIQQLETLLKSRLVKLYNFLALRIPISCFFLNN